MATPTDTATRDSTAKLRAELQRQATTFAQLSAHVATTLEHVLRATRVPEPGRRDCENLVADLRLFADGAGLNAGTAKIAPASFDMHTTVRAAVANEAFAAAERQVRLRCYVHRDVPRCVVGDGPRLRRVLTTMLQSMVRATESSEVAVYVAPEWTRTDTCAIRVAIRDRGDGPVEPSPDRTSRNPANAAVEDAVRFPSLMLMALREQLRHLGGQLGLEGDEASGCTFWFTATLQSRGAQCDRVVAPHLPVLLASSHPERIPPIMIALQRVGIVVELADGQQQVADAAQRGKHSLILVDAVHGAHLATFAARSQSGEMRTVPVAGIPLLSGSTTGVDEAALLRLVNRWVQPTR